MSFPTVAVTPRKHAADYDTYDMVVARLCNALKLVDANGVPTVKKVPLIFAVPERAWAAMREKFGGDRATDPSFPVPLPFLSVSQIGDWEVDPSRHLYKANRYRKIAVDQADWRKSLAIARPIPLTFQYSIELWVKTRLEASVHRTQFAALFDEGGMTHRKVDLGSPIGVKWAPIFITGNTDNTSLEVAEQQRSLRYTFTVRVEGWLPTPAIEQHLVHSISADIEAPASLCDADDPYADDLVESYVGFARGNPETGQVVEPPDEFDDAYSGTDYRTWRLQGLDNAACR